MDIPVFVCLVVHQLLMAVLELLSLPSLELSYYVNTSQNLDMCAQKCFLEQTVENVSPIKVFFLLEYLLEGGVAHT